MELKGPISCKVCVIYLFIKYFFLPYPYYKHNWSGVLFHVFMFSPQQLYIFLYDRQYIAENETFQFRFLIYFFKEKTTNGLNNLQQP